MPCKCVEVLHSRTDIAHCFSHLTHYSIHTALELQPHGRSLPIEFWAFCSVSLESLDKVAIALWLCSGALPSGSLWIPLHPLLIYRVSSSFSFSMWLVRLLWWDSAHYIDMWHPPFTMEAPAVQRIHLSIPVLILVFGMQWKLNKSLLIAGKN